MAIRQRAQEADPHVLPPTAKREKQAQMNQQVIYPEHGTGRTAPLATCGHCGGKPLIVRRCPRDENPAKFCALCQQCGHHQEVSKADLKTRSQQAQALLEIRQVKAIVGRLESEAKKKATRR